jgi:hypothetical protein
VFLHQGRFYSIGDAEHGAHARAVNIRIQYAHYCAFCPQSEREIYGGAGFARATFTEATNKTCRALDFAVDKSKLSVGVSTSINIENLQYERSVH